MWNFARKGAMNHRPRVCLTPGEKDGHGVAKNKMPLGTSRLADKAKDRLDAAMEITKFGQRGGEIEHIGRKSSSRAVAGELKKASLRFSRNGMMRGEKAHVT